MKYYKYKSITDFEHIVNILVNNRLYASNFKVNNSLDNMLEKALNMKKEHY